MVGGTASNNRINSSARGVILIQKERETRIIILFILISGFHEICNEKEKAVNKNKHGFSSHRNYNETETSTEANFQRYVYQKIHVFVCLLVCFVSFFILGSFFRQRERKNH